LSRPEQDKRGRRRDRRRNAPGGDHRRHRIPLTPEGVPAAVPDAPPVSPVVFVTDDSLARYPWLPPRVIARSVWRGPGHLRVQVDEHGTAVPWRTGPGSARGSSAIDRTYVASAESGSGAE
jgi:hypothetical protein